MLSSVGQFQTLVPAELARMFPLFLKKWLIPICVVMRLKRMSRKNNPMLPLPPLFCYNVQEIRNRHNRDRVVLAQPQQILVAADDIV